MPGRLVPPLALSIGLLAAASPARGGSRTSPPTSALSSASAMPSPSTSVTTIVALASGSAFEVEQSELLSGVFRFDWNEMRAPSRAIRITGRPTRAVRSLGRRERGSAGRVDGSLQPYSEALLGARMVYRNATTRMPPVAPARPWSIRTGSRVSFTSGSRPRLEATRDSSSTEATSSPSSIQIATPSFRSGLE